MYVCWSTSVHAPQLILLIIARAETKKRFEIAKWQETQFNLVVVV